MQTRCHSEATRLRPRVAIRLPPGARAATRCWSASCLTSARITLHRPGSRIVTLRLRWNRGRRRGDWYRRWLGTLRWCHDPAV